MDLSLGCAGIWFDAQELDKVDQPHELLGDLLIAHITEQNRPVVDVGPRLNCPRDPDVVMMRHYFSPERRIEIDECPVCGGIWLDAEELEGIHALFEYAADRTAADEAFVKAVMSSPEVEKLEREHEEFMRKIDGVVATLSRNVFEWK